MGWSCTLIVGLLASIVSGATFDTSFNPNSSPWGDISNEDASGSYGSGGQISQFPSGLGRQDSSALNTFGRSATDNSRGQSPSTRFDAGSHNSRDLPFAESPNSHDSVFPTHHGASNRGFTSNTIPGQQAGQLTGQRQSAAGLPDHRNSHSGQFFGHSSAFNALSSFSNNNREQFSGSSATKPSDFAGNTPGAPSSHSRGSFESQTIRNGIGSPFTGQAHNLQNQRRITGQEQGFDNRSNRHGSFNEQPRQGNLFGVQSPHHDASVGGPATALTGNRYSSHRHSSESQSSFSRPGHVDDFTRAPVDGGNRLTKQSPNQVSSFSGTPNNFGGPQRGTSFGSGRPLAGLGNTFADHSTRRGSSFAGQSPGQQTASGRIPEDHRNFDKTPAGGSTFGRPGSRFADNSNRHVGSFGDSRVNPGTSRAPARGSGSLSGRPTVGRGSSFSQQSDGSNRNVFTGASGTGQDHSVSNSYLPPN